MSWNQKDAIEFATMLEQVTPSFGCHVGLTGGCLYKEGERKDCDILLYRIRQAEEISINPLMDKLQELGLVIFKGFGFCYKCEWHGKSVDILIPEEPGGAYQDEQDGPPISEPEPGDIF